MKSWTVSLFLKWLPYLTITSTLRMRDHEMRYGRNEITRVDTIVLNLWRPFRAALTLREYGTDIGTMEEVFVDQVYRQVVEQLPNCSTVVDLGANIGMASLYFAWHYPHAKIVAVEPHPETCNILRKNVDALIKSHRCAIEHAAIWSSDRNLLYSELDSGYSVVAIRDPEDEANGASGAVTGITMPRLMERYTLSSIDLLKIDIEGSETELFRGDTSWLDFVNAIAIEFHGNSRAESGFDGLMRQHGFREVDCSDHTVLVVRETR
jgi:FkbM family methyltransferase